MSRNNGSQSKLQFWIIFFFQLFFLTVPLFFTWVNEELFEFNKIILVYAFTVIIGTLWLSRMITQKKLIWKKTPFDIPILLFFISQLLSTVFSINFHTSVFGYYTRFNGGLLSTMCYITLFYAFVHNVEKKHLSGIFFSTFLSALAVSLIAIPEHFGHSLSCLMIGVNRGSSFSLSLYDTSCWIQDVQTRVFATFGQPNWLAAYAITLIPLGVLLSSGKLEQDQSFKIKTWQRWFYAITSFALFLTLLFTKSRSGFIGLIIGGIFAMGVLILQSFLSGGSQSLASKTQKIKTLVLGLKETLLIGQIILVIFSIGFLGTPYSPSFSTILTHQKATQAAPAPVAQTVNRLDEGGTDSGEIRRIVWTGAIKVWQRYPLLGSGVETFAYSYYKDRPMAHNLVSEWDFLYNKAHNEFLNYLATTGLLGLGTYLIFLCAAIIIPVFLKTQKRDAFLIGVMVSSGIVALSVSNFFGFSTVMVSALLFLLPAEWYVISQHKSADPIEEIPAESLSSTQIVLLCLLSFMSLVLLFRVYNMWESDYLFATGKQNSQANQVNVGLPMLQQAVMMSPDEPYFYEELAVTDARIAAALGTNNNATAAAQFAKNSIDLSDQMLEMNPVNLNFYKSKARIYSLLAELDPKFIETAKSALQKARTLAPTDPKLMYNIALIELGQDLKEQGIMDLQKVLEMKPNYIQPRLSLAAEYLQANKLTEAKEQYEYILKNIQSSDPTSIEALKKIATASGKMK